MLSPVLLFFWKNLTPSLFCLSGVPKSYFVCGLCCVFELFSKLNVCYAMAVSLKNPQKRLLKTFHIKPLQSIKSGLNHTHTHSHTVFELFKEKHMAKGADGVVCNCLSKTWNMINDLGAQIMVLIIKELLALKSTRNQN